MSCVSPNKSRFPKAWKMALLFWEELMKRRTRQLILRIFPAATLVLRAAALILHSAEARAQETEEQIRDTVYQLAPVVITPTRAVERLTPATFSNLTQHEIQSRYSLQDIPALLSDLPSTTSYSENGNDIGYSYVNLRGFDQRRLSIMVNGVPQNDPEDHNVYWIDLPDLLASSGDIQVQRGAGSAFYGPPAIGGSINIVTNPFALHPMVTLESIFGIQEFGDSSGSLVLTTRKHAASVNSGLIQNRYALYGRLSTINSDGYRQNAWTNLDAYFLGAVRFDKGMSTRIHLFGGPIEDGLAYYGLPKFVNDNKILRRQNLSYWETDSNEMTYTYVLPRRPQEIENFSQPHYEMLHDWQLTPNVTLHNTLFYYQGDGFFDYDASWADTSMLRLGSQYGIPTDQNPTNPIVRASVANKQWGWLPRIEVNHTNGTLVKGGELRIHRSGHWGQIKFAEGLPSNSNPDYRFYEYNGEKDIFSLFVHELFRATDDLTLMADLQLIRNRYGITDEKYLGNTFSISYLFLNPRVGVNYNMNKETNGYISIAYTSREPRLRNLYAAEDSWFGATPQFVGDTTGGIAHYDFTAPLAKPERLFDIELGVGYATSQSRLSANLFWMEFTDELVRSGKIDIFGQPVTGNAERTRHVGLELDGVLAVGDAWELSGNTTLSRNRLVRFRVFDNSGASVILDGNPIAGFPDILANLRLTYHQPSFSTSLAMKHVGGFHTDNFNNPENRNDAYTVLNLEVLYTTPRVWDSEFTIRLEVRNLLNRLYLSGGEGNAFFPAAERNYLIGIVGRF
jgi:iron complex outermembrane receptor protein